MNGEILIARSKKYTNLVALGLSNVSVNGTTITFTLNNGETASVTLPIPKDGVSITDIGVNTNKELIVTLSDGNTINAGTIPAIKGDKGEDGYTPQKGTDYWTTEDIAEIQSYIDAQIGGTLNDSY